ncbi:piwi-like protein Ago3 isoform X2 [Centruroides vittatus]|uniref:piwi-like protein Ago3 isoform X2 n=1 Tax=Centruroides vittatus TaxID=120091 RepID=UPI00350F061A
MAEQRTFGCGRGGRGALLLEALKSHTRRPGITSESKEAPVSEHEAGDQTQKVTIGRGKLLQMAMQKASSSKSNEDSSHISSQSSLSSQSIPKPVGRGMLGRGASLLSLKQDTLRHLPSSSAASTSGSASSSFSAAGFTPASEISTRISSKFTPLDSSKSEISSVQESIDSKESSSLSDKMCKLALKQRNAERGGQSMEVEVNYVKLHVMEGKGVFEYHVNFIPQVDSKGIRFKLLNDPKVRTIIGKTKTFDGAKLFLPFKLNEKITAVSVTSPIDQSEIMVNIKFVGKGSSSDYMHLYNILFRKIMYKLKMTNIGRNFFDPKGGITVPQHKLEVWPGYITAIQEFDGGIMLNCDASFKVLRSVTAWDILTELTHTHTKQIQDMAAKQLLGSVVLTRYNNKTYRVDDIDWNQSPLSTFTNSMGQSITYKDYYKKSYDIDIKDNTQPLLIHHPKKKNIPGAAAGGNQDSKFLCLIPELSYLTGLTDTMRSDFKVMKDIASHTRITPNQRHLAIKRFVENINSNPETVEDLSAWGLRLEDAAVNLNGTSLPFEVIYFKDNRIETTEECDWGRNVTRSGVIVAVDLETWLIVFWKRDSNRAHDFIQMMRKISNGIGIRINDPRKIEINDDRTETYLKAVRDNVNPQVQIVVVIFPTARDDRYSAIKKLCCVEMPVPSQVINSRTISDHKKLRSVAQKIALQMNCKLGGELWSLQIPFKSVMVCGFDSYHDQAVGRRSVLGFVASLNQTVTRWFSMAKFQQKGQELGDYLKICLLSALRKYYQVNHFLPNKIFIFRDGVSDGQLNHVAKYEVEQFTTSFKHFQQDYNPQLTVVVVQKRINTRIFHRLRGDLSNPNPGAVVDHTVTKKNWYDFFLVSQHVRQGTVSPTHYIIVHDTNDLSPYFMQRLTYKMTHLYYNWPGTVRVPAPCQYAHKLAYLVGQNIHKEPNVHLTDKLFFL